MADWVVISSLATAGGTLVLAAATFSSVQSANRAARTAERSLLVGLRPLLLASRPQDPPEKVMWHDRHFAHVQGGQAVVEFENDVVYLAANLRNSGAGVAVLHGWSVTVGAELAQRDPDCPDGSERFHRLTRDLYIPPADTGFWQGAIRDPDDPDRPALLQAIEERERIGIDVVYGDHEGGQRSVTRLLFTPVSDDRWLCSTVRHFNLDRGQPR
jgi:hypothetical protein